MAYALKREVTMLNTTDAKEHYVVVEYLGLNETQHELQIKGPYSQKAATLYSKRINARDNIHAITMCNATRGVKVIKKTVDEIKKQYEGKYTKVFLHASDGHMEILAHMPTYERRRSV